MAEKVRYSDEELEEFKALILEKLEAAKKEYDQLRASMTNTDGNEITDTSRSYNALEEGTNTMMKESDGRLAQRQVQFIKHLQDALLRIENKTYGVCRVTGKLIPKERLRAVPHATLSIEAKNAKKK